MERLHTVSVWHSENGHGVPRDRAKSVGYLCRAAALQYVAIAAIRHLQGTLE